MTTKKIIRAKTIGMIGMSCVNALIVLLAQNNSKGRYAILTYYNIH